MSAASAVLPNELWRPVVAAVTSKHDLANLSCVSRLFQQESERILYRSIILHPASTHDLCHTLQDARAGRRLGALVRECTVYLVTKGHLKPDSLLALLSRMPGLQCLSLRGPLPNPTHPKQLPSKGYAFPFRLRRLSTTEPLNKPLTRFLEAQPDIEQLNLINPTAPCAAPAKLPPLPALSHVYSLNIPSAVAVLPHYRPSISHLHLTAWDPAAAPAFIEDHLAGPLRALLATKDMRLPAADLALFARYLPDLAFLADVHLDDPVDAYLPHLRACAALDTLVIARDSRGLEARFSEPAVVRAMGDACAPLRRVAFTERMYAEHVWMRCGAAEPWVRCKIEDACTFVEDEWKSA